MKKGFRTPPASSKKVPSPQEMVPLCDALLAEVNQCLAQKNREGALAVYQKWVKDWAGTPYTIGVQFNMGILLMELGKPAEARKCFEVSSTQPSLRDLSLQNLGLVYERTEPVEKAVDLMRKAISKVSTTAIKIEMLNNLGLFCERNLKFSEAIHALEKSLELNPAQTKVMWHLVSDRRKLCQWPEYRALPNVSSEMLETYTPPLMALGITDDPAVQIRASRRLCSEVTQVDGSRFVCAPKNEGERIRIGYLSSNLSLHAVSILTAELYELHNRQEFEVYIFSWTDDMECGMLARIRHTADHFVDIREMTDAEATQVLRDAKLDVLVDLQGLSKASRPQIFANRVAPLQITYLGFPGPCSCPALDYVIADDFVLPVELEPYFDEKPIRMKQCFQVNDRKRMPASDATRSSLGISEDAFIFGVFNNPLKFRQDVFGVWMGILKRVPGSLLWLLTYEKETQDSLLKHAAAAGVDKSRIVFASLISPDDNLARYRATDVVLDTFPFNGGTSTSDALWMGTPVVTCSGRSFASRMSGSLLRTIGAPELITDSLEAYADCAVRLAHEPELLAEVRRKIATGRETSALFDTPAFVREYEEHIKRLLPIHRAMYAE